MRIRNMQFELTFHHKEVPATRIGAVETKSPQSLDKLFPRDALNHRGKKVSISNEIALIDL